MSTPNIDVIKMDDLRNRANSMNIDTTKLSTKKQLMRAIMATTRKIAKNAN